VLVLVTIRYVFSLPLFKYTLCIKDVLKQEKDVLEQERTFFSWTKTKDKHMELYP
jgi:hypothetical protein